jgi:outer membrane protein assembly factor BamB
VSNDPEPRENGVHVNVAQFDPLQGRAHRGNLYRDGVFQSSGVSSGARIKWSFKTGGAVKSSPVVVDNIAFFGSYDGYVYAVEVANGQEVWRHRTDGPVSGSAAVVNGMVYIASQDGCMVALAVASGKEIWKTKCGSAMAGSPAVAYGAVFIGSGNRAGDQQLVMTAGPMVALDAATGTEIWRGEGGPQGVAAIASDGRRVFGVSSDLYGALDMRDGSRLFDVRAGHQTRQFASMTVAGDKVYAPVATRGAVLCLDASDRVLWQQATLPLNNRLEINNGGIPGYEILGDLAVTSELVLAGCNDGSLHAFSATTGQRVWQFLTNGPVQSSPSVAGHTMYFGSWDGHLYAVNRADGTLRWKLDLGNMPQTSAEQYTFGPDEGGRIVSSPWPAEGAVYVGCDNGYLYAIEGME